MSKLLCTAILIIACASIAFSQSTADYNKVEFFGGFSHNRVDTGIDDGDDELSDVINEREGFNGFNASITGNVTRYIGLKFDVAGHFKKKDFPLGIGNASVEVDSSVFNFLGGVQLKDNSKEARFKPFAHALIGAARVRTKVDFNEDVCEAIFPSPCPIDATETETGLAGAIGGGLDFRLNDRIDIRAVQLDYNPTRVGGSTQHNFRVGVGLVFH
jgi:opacity protein-like surface antigen